MVWGAMGLRGKTPLVVIQGNMDAARYRNEILIPHLLPLMNTMPNNARLFQQDNAPPHRARATFAWFQANNIDVLQPWPASSPDLNPMENLWDHLDNVVRNQPVPPRDPAETARALTPRGRRGRSHAEAARLLDAQALSLLLTASGPTIDSF